VWKLFDPPPGKNTKVSHADEGSPCAQLEEYLSDGRDERDDARRSGSRNVLAAKSIDDAHEAKSNGACPGSAPPGMPDVSSEPMPLWIDNDRLREAYREIALRNLQQAIPIDDRRYEFNRLFALNRVNEGIELVPHFEGKYSGRPLVIVDVGAGNGGAAIALANERRNLVVAMDLVPNPTLVALRKVTGIPVRQVVASAFHLPFRDRTVDVVLCLETVEHLERLRQAAAEMMRLLTSDGQIMITTPARLRFLFAPDPHFAIPGLLLLPDRVQKFVVQRWFRRVEHYDVHHLYWTAWGIIRAFPGRGRTETLVGIPWPGRPRNLREILWKIFRHLLWDRIIIYRR